MQEKQYQPIVGKDIFLRLATENDAPFLFDLRSNAKNKFVHPVDDYSSHCAWLRKTCSRHDDYFFIVTEGKTGIPLGTVSIYNIDFIKSNAEIGRWVMVEKSRLGFAAVELAYKFAFDIIKLNTVYAEVVTENKPVMAFHLACGLEKTESPFTCIVLRGQNYYLQQLFATREMWPKIQANINKFICMMEKPQ